MNFTDYCPQCDPSSYADYTEEDQRLHDFVISHNRKLRDITTIVNNIMWSLYALCDAFEGFQFVTMDENKLASIVSSYGFTPHFNSIINQLIESVKHQSASAHRYDVLQGIAHKYNLTPNDMLNVAKTNFAELTHNK